MSGREVTARATLARDQGACTVADLDAVRYEVVRADVLADVAKQAFDLTNWRVVDAARIDHVGTSSRRRPRRHLRPCSPLHDLRRAMVRRSAVPSGEVWSDG
jgi:hypothetical protein